MTDDQNQELYEAMRSDLETGECALLDDSRSGPTVVRFCRETLGVIDSGSHQERSRPFRTAPQGIFADTRQALRAIRMEMDRRHVAMVIDLVAALWDRARDRRLGLIEARGSPVEAQRPPGRFPMGWLGADMRV